MSLKIIFLYCLMPVWCTVHLQGQTRADSLYAVLSNNSNDYVFIIAHRGDWRHAPENSLTAIQNCIEMGIDMVEIDVQRTKDGVFVLMHDGSIDRTTNGSGNVWELEWDYLKDLYLVDANGVLSQERIPTFNEALDLAKGKVLLNLDEIYWYIDDVYLILKNRGQVREVLFKASMKSLEQVREEIQTPLDSINFIPIVSLDENNWEEIISSYGDYKPLAMEIIFKDDQKLDDAVALIRNQSAKVWANTMWDFMCAGRDDDLAETNPENSYGWLFDKGINVFQTDNIHLMDDYFNSKRKRILAKELPKFYLGADLSYVNEMNDCGAIYTEGGEPKDVYDIFADKGTNLIRYRLWHNPDSINGYSFYQDVERGIARAKAKSIDVLLDFHYSDIWADPSRQWRPMLWDEIDDDQVLADSVYNYTYQILQRLHAKGLTPEYVQIGNETNGNILQKITTTDLRESSPNNSPVDWARQVLLFNHGLAAVEDFNSNFSQNTQTVIHIAQPQNIEWWFDAAIGAGLADFDIIGLSYYPRWSDYNVRQVGDAVKLFREKFNKEVMVVEVSYPWSGDNEGLETRSARSTPEEQRDFMIELSYLVKENGGLGVIYWEPAWVDTECETLWQTGSSHDWHIFFDNDNEVIPASFEFYAYDYSNMPKGLAPQKVSFSVDMGGQENIDNVFITGDFSDEDGWTFLPMTKNTETEVYSYETTILGRSVGAYIFYSDDSWSDEFKETVPEKCADSWDTHRKYVVKDDDLAVQFAWSSCQTAASEEEVLGLSTFNDLAIYPNPTSGLIMWDKEAYHTIKLYSVTGKKILELDLGKVKQLDLSAYPSGIYLLSFDGSRRLQRIVVK